MTYFVVLPVFLVWLASGLIAITVLRAKAPAWSGIALVVHVFLWSTLGVILANALLIAVLALGASHVPEASASSSVAQDVLRMLWGMLSILGPFAASALGWLFGVMVGIGLGCWRIRKARGRPG